MEAHSGRELEAAVAYVRVSTEEQAAEGVSLAAQEARLRAYAALRGLQIVQVIVDAGVSGGVPLGERAGGQQLEAALRLARKQRNGDTSSPDGHAKRDSVADAPSGGSCKADSVAAFQVATVATVATVARGQRVAVGKRPVHVLAVKLDRLFRSTSDALETTSHWNARGVSLHLTDMGGSALDTSSAMGRFFLTMLAAVAEMERGLIGERTSAALQHKKAKGEQVSSDAPIGYRHEAGRLVVDEKEQATLEFIRAERARMASLRAITAKLNADLDRFTPRGRTWHLPTVARLVRAMASTEEAA